MIEKTINTFCIYLKRNERSIATLTAYKKDLAQIFSFLENSDNILNVTSEHLETSLAKMKSDLELSDKSLSRKINSLKSFYRFLLKKKIIKDNITISLKHPKFFMKKPRILSEFEYLKIKDACTDNPKSLLLFETMIQTGLRISEVAVLKFSDINLIKPNPTLRVSIKNHERFIPLNSKIVNLFKRYLDLEKEGYVFGTKNRRPMEVRNIRAAFERIFKKLGITDVTVNDIRNTFIYYQLQKGISLKYLMRIVDHKSLSSAQRFAELLPFKYVETGDQKVREI